MSKAEQQFNEEVTREFLFDIGVEANDIDTIVKGAREWSGSGLGYIEKRIRESGGAVVIPHSEYEIATGGKKMFDAVVIRARNKIPKKGETIRTEGAPYGTATRFTLDSSDESISEEINQAIRAERERINACIDHIFDGLSDELVALSRSLKMAVNERYSTKS